MRRRAFLYASAALLVTPPVAGAQQAGKVYRIGYLTTGSPVADPRLIEVFRQGLREFGWVEGQNIGMELRFVEGRFDRLPDLAAELVRLQVDMDTYGHLIPGANKAVVDRLDDATGRNLDATSILTTGGSNG